MAGLDTDFLAAINPVKIQVATNTITDGGVTDVMYDMFFLQSVEELYGSPLKQDKDIEGPYFPYWKTITGLENPTNGSSSNMNDARKICRINAPTGDATNAFLRSAYTGSAFYVWNVSSDGWINYSYAENSYAAIPACVIS